MSPFDALHLMRVAMRGQFSDEILKEFIALLGGFTAAAASLEADDLDDDMKAAG